MDLRSHLNGNKQIQLLNILLQRYVDDREATIGLTEEGQIGYSSEGSRIMYFDGSSSRTLANIDDIQSGNGNNVYISDTEPREVSRNTPLSLGDIWYTPSTTTLRILVDLSGLTVSDRWNNLIGTTSTFTIPALAVSTEYSDLSVFVYFDRNSGVSNGNGSVWQNQSGSNKTTPTTVSSEADLTAAEFTRISTPGSGSNNIQLTLDSSWSNGSFSVGSFTVNKTGNVYTSDLGNTNFPKDISIIRTSDNKRVYTNFEIDGNSIEVTFKNSITSDMILNITV